MFCVELFAVVAATHCNIHGLGVPLRDNFEIESTLPTPTSPPPDTKLSKVIAHGSIISAFSLPTIIFSPHLPFTHAIAFFPPPFLKSKILRNFTLELF